MRPFYIIILGPTGVGKTDFSLELAHALSGEVINADMGQFYTALSIGTAKPAWKDKSVTKGIPHHLFDLIDQPVDFTAFMFRNQCRDVINSIIERKHTPLVVGGSGFYVKSLFYEVTAPSKQMLQQNSHKDISAEISDISWQALCEIDPQRASKIHPNDFYRIERALSIWHSTGVLPSACEPTYNPLGNCLVLFLDRDVIDLKQRAALRTGIMMQEGWLDEVKGLSPEWRAFASDKLIGYRELEQLMTINNPTQQDIQVTMDAIIQRTNTYARRQRIFWRSLKKELSQKGVWFEEFNLTLLDHTLYIKQLLEKINTLMTSDTHAE